MNKLILTLLISLSVFSEEIWIDKNIYQVLYNTELEQPVFVSYTVTDRPKNVDRKGLNFYKEDDIHTSDNKDYYKNIWDKGHMAPAAHFSDSMENLKDTFSFVNSALQHEKLNRGAWRFLEAAVRKWGEKEDLYVENIIIFNKNSLVLDTGATVPDGFEKRIFFQDSNIQKCFFFANEAPDMKWNEYEVECESEKEWSIPWDIPHSTVNIRG